MLNSRLALIVSAALVASPVVAQQTMDHSKMGGMAHGGMKHGEMMKNTPANPYAEAEMRMHEKMMPAVGADASETWVRKMIEHHRGGVETSRIAVAQAKDRQVRAMAQKTMAMQQKEITELQNWLKSHGKRPQ